MVTRHAPEPLPPGWDTEARPLKMVRGRTYSHYMFDEASSAAQKAIRRGYPIEAVQWLLEMFWSGPDAPRTNAWNRCLVMCVEDIGPADPQLLPAIWNMSESHRHDPLAMASAAAYLAEAKKCRINDWKTMLVPALKDSAVADATIDSAGGTSGAAYRLSSALISKEEGACHYWVMALVFTTYKVRGRYSNAQSLIWSTFKEVLPGPYTAMACQFGLSNNWRWQDKTRLVMSHLINLWCNDRYPTTVKWELPLRQELSEYVKGFKMRDPQLVVGIPDYALDKHTGRGRSLKRDMTHFFEVGAVLNNREPEWAAYDEWCRRHVAGLRGLKLAD